MNEQIDPLTLDLNALRRRVLDGEVIEPHIARAAIERLRAGRKLATATAAVKGKSTKVRGMSDEELSADLDAALGL